jgi:hypothetical protein
MPRAQKRKRAHSSRQSRSQARGGKGSGGGDKPLKMVARSGQWTSPKSAAGRSTAVLARVGTGVAGACTQSAAGIGQGTPSQSEQWLQGVLDVPLCVVVPPTGKANAATDTNPLARTARQASVAAKERKRITPYYCPGASGLPVGPLSQLRDAAQQPAASTAGPPAALHTPVSGSTSSTLRAASWSPASSAVIERTCS